MDASRSETVASKEVVVKELLEILVDPHLPLSIIPPGDPPIDKQHSVAKQLHAVVLLYNYYHRKQYPEAEYLDFKSFCELVVTLKPVLAWHMNCKSQSDSAEMNDSENQFSISEKAIQDACNLSFVLDASKTNPIIEGWEISKVSVLLLDSKMENCFLMFCSINDGVWSVLEKDLKYSTSDSKLEERKDVNKRRRTGTKSLPSEPKVTDSRLQQLAFLAVKDATGIRRSDLVVLEKHVVYSLTKAKTTACFYLIQCSQPTSLNFQTPIDYVIKSLQGPLVEDSSGCWFTTPVVEYFHLLPYATIISAWFSRDTSPSSLHGSISRSPEDAENSSGFEVSGNDVASSKMEDSNIKTLDCLDNQCNNMVSEINLNSDRSTNSAKSSGKEEGASASSEMIGKEKTVDERESCIDGDCDSISKRAEYGVEVTKPIKDIVKEIECLKEVVVKVLLDLLVEPHLPLLTIPSGDPPIHKQRRVAKQLHAVVLLYNYYHRKQYPQAEYLDFKSFCELVVTLKPVLAWHMNCKSQSDSAELNDSENQFSVAEKAIQDACNLSFILDASKTNPVIEEAWEVSKVTVLLVDSKKENCYILFGSVTEGVWSVLEKDVSNRRIGMKSLPGEPKTNDSRLPQLAFTAVLDATACVGIQRSDLVVLEKHVVYSLCKAKTTDCFYIIQSSQSRNLDFHTPIEDVIKSLQGPLVENRSGCWFSTPVVEYFHLLPYATIISAWFYRDISPSSLHGSISRSPEDAENSSGFEVSGNEIASLKLEDTNINTLDCLDNHSNNMVSEINENSDRSTNSAKSSGKEVGASASSEMIGKEKTVGERESCIDGDCDSIRKCAEFGVEEAKPIKDIVKEVSSQGTSFTGNELNKVSMESPDLEKICDGQTKDAADAGVNECTKQCHKEEEVALFDKSIHGILDGGDDDVEVEGKEINECCEGTHTQEVQDQHFVDSGSLPLADSKELESVAPSLQPASQDLDVINEFSGERFRGMSYVRRQKPRFSGKSYVRKQKPSNDNRAAE